MLPSKKMITYDSKPYDVEVTFAWLIEQFRVTVNTSFTRFFSPTEFGDTEQKVARSIVVAITEYQAKLAVIEIVNALPGELKPATPYELLSYSTCPEFSHFMKGTNPTNDVINKRDLMKEFMRAFPAFSPPNFALTQTRFKTWLHQYARIICGIESPKEWRAGRDHFIQFVDNKTA